MNPLITTIIPTYRRPEKLRQAILSALHQTYKNIQVCVYDNASGDETASVVSEIMKNDSRLKYYCHSQNIGAGLNFQYGLEQVNTPYFSFLSDDDLLLPDFYETSLVYFDKFPECGFVANEVFIILKDGRILNSNIANWSPGIYYPNDGIINMVKLGVPTWTGTLFKSEIIKDVGLLDIETGYLSDRDFLYRVAINYPFVITKRPCALFDEQYLYNSKLRCFDGYWPGEIRIADNLFSNTKLPIDIRGSLRKQIIKRFEDGLLKRSLQYVYHDQKDDALKAANIIKVHFKDRKRYYKLIILIKILEIRMVFKICQFYRFMRSRLADRIYRPKSSMRDWWR